MRLSILSSAALAATIFAAPAFAEGLEIHDAYARAASPTAKSGAAFMMIENHGDSDDRLIAAQSDVAVRVELHTHIEDANGVMSMVEVKDGFVVPAGGMAMLKRGGQHVMMMGLNQPFEQGETVEVTLTFENAGDVTVEIPIDNERMDKGGHDHGHSHSN